MYFLFREGVFGWEELPRGLQEKEEAADWRAVRTTLGADWPAGVWLKSEVTLVIWKPLLFLPPLILTNPPQTQFTQLKRAPGAAPDQRPRASVSLALR